MSSNNLSSHIVRMEKEVAELDAKINSLVAFFPTVTFKKLPDEKRVLMYNQLQYMERYLEVLKKRLALEAKPVPSWDDLW